MIEIKELERKGQFQIEMGCLARPFASQLRKAIPSRKINAAERVILDDLDQDSQAINRLVVRGLVGDAVRRKVQQKIFKKIVFLLNGKK